jgi:cytochrome oxidase Cu insertion factor (SCO1/SenC/PrrC family)
MAGLAIASFVFSIFAEVPSIFRPKAKLPDPDESLVPVASRFALPDFTLTERSGKKVHLQDLRGNVVIASFIFTRCTMGCPSVTTTMKRLQTELNLESRDDLILLTITVDPERDQLDDLRKYAKVYNAHDTKWLFLTGTEEVVRPLLKQGFKIGADKKADPKPGDEFDHSTRLAIIDKQGRVCTYIDGKQGDHDEDGSRFNKGLQRLKAIVDELVNEY